MAIKILIVVAVAIIVLVAVIATRPSDFRITRSASIVAPTAVVFGQVNDFHKWEAWSPWARMDPTSKSSYEGAPFGNGAIFRWAGNNKVGEGNMTIIESRPNELVQIKLEFLKPFTATHIAEFTFKPEGAQTIVTWSMYGKNNFMAKAVGLLMNCDKMIGAQFEQGLADMKSIAEGRRNVGQVAEKIN